MKFTCLDCPAPIVRKSKFGMRPLRCTACKKAKINEKSRRYHAKNRERELKRMSKWYAKNRKDNPEWGEKNKRRAKIWREKNRERVKEYYRRKVAA